MPGSSTLITDYLGAGTAANRPAAAALTAALPANAAAIYVETDTDLVFALVAGAWVEFGFQDAPNDGFLYGRKSLAWAKIAQALAGLADVDLTTAPTNGQVLTWEADDAAEGGAGRWIASAIPAPAVGEAPEDGNAYVRHEGAWEELPPYPAAGIPDAPNDGNLYGRKSEAWAEVPSGGGGIPEAPEDGQLYGRKSGAWSPVTGGGGGGGGLGPSIPYLPALVTPPAASSFGAPILYGSSAGSISSLASGRGVLAQSTASSNVLLEFPLASVAIPAGDFQAALFASPAWNMQGNWHYGVYLKDDAGKLTSWGIRNNAWSEFQYNADGSLNAVNTHDNMPNVFQPSWMRTLRQGANLVFQASLDGESWFTEATEGVTSFLTANIVGAGLTIHNNAGQAMAFSAFALNVG